MSASAPAPANQRFDYCKFIELDYVPMETDYMVSMRPTKGYASSRTPSKSYASPKSPCKGYGSNKAPSKGFDSTKSSSKSFDSTKSSSKGFDSLKSSSKGFDSTKSSSKGFDSTKSPSKGFDSTKSSSKGCVSTSPEHHSHSEKAPSTPRTRRPPAPSNHRHPLVNEAHSSSSNSGSCKGSDCSPTKGRQQKYSSCVDNHGIRPPPPEQYLTPLQQKEVCIRHLRARLKETVDRLQDRDTEIDELRGQLSRMQEDWIQEECHRVEAQVALKEAWCEIQQLKNVVDTVHNSLSEDGGLSGDEVVQKFFLDINAQNHKLENLLLNMEIAQASMAKEVCGSRGGGSAPASVSGECLGAVPRPPAGGRAVYSCDVSPAGTLTRSSTYTRLGEQALADGGRNGPGSRCLSGDGTQDSCFECCGDSNIPCQVNLLLEAALLSEETTTLLNSYSQSFPHSLTSSLPSSYSHTLPPTLPHNRGHSIPHSATYEKPCTGDGLAPFHYALGEGSSVSQPCLHHHHLFLHHLRETGIQTESCPVPTTASYPSDLDTITEQRTFRSQACSPTSTWISDEGEEEIDSIATMTSRMTSTIVNTATEQTPVSENVLLSPLPHSSTVSCSMEIPMYSKEEEEEEDNDIEKELCTVEKPGKETSTESMGDRLLEASEKGVDLEPERLDQNHCEQSRQMNTAGYDERTYQNALEEHIPTAGSELHCSLELGRCNSRGQPGENIEVNLHNCSETQLELQEVEVFIQTEATQGDPSNPGMSDVEMPHTSQPKRSTKYQTVLLNGDSVHIEDCAHVDSEKQGALDGSVDLESEPDPGTVQKSYWSRHFLVDLLAVAVPMVPTVAWLCRGPVRNTQPMYHIGSFLRGCCTVALHSLRRGGGLRHYPAGGGDLGGTQI